MTERKIRNLSLLIKPASSSCNLSCAYCFYFDEAKNRAVSNYGNMSYETLSNLVKNAFFHAEETVSFMFQGGEPTVRGIDFFYKFHELVETYNQRKIGVSYSIQTNGTLLNKEWVSLFKRFRYLVGISIDGMKEIHDMFRLDYKNEGSFDRVLENLYLLREEGIDFNILTVVNSEVAKRGEEIYRYFRDNGFEFMQFIPALDPIIGKADKNYELSAKDYGVFLDDVFRVWYEDIKKGHFSSIRYYENLLLILLGRRPEACDMVGHCSVNAVIEADGSVYPCDFYVLDERRLGNINESGIVEILTSEKAVRFVKESYTLHVLCKECRYLKLCRSGCRRHKNEENYNKFCESYQFFFDRNLTKLLDVADILRKNF